MTTTAQGDGNPGPRRLPSRTDNTLVRAVGRVRATVLTKLLVAFFTTVALLVVLGVLGLRVIGDSNDRVVTLRILQQRAAAYRQFQGDVKVVQQLLTLRVGRLPQILHDLNFKAFSSDAARLVVDLTITSVLATNNSLTDPALLGFVPPDDEKQAVELIGRDYAQLSDVMTTITDFDRLPTFSGVAGGLVQDAAQPLANHIRRVADTLVNETQGATESLVELNRTSFSASQNLFIAAALGSIILALLLGYVLSWSIVGPIRHMQTRLAAIASGDFSGHVEVSNRDELGALASNLNRMNDELGRLYQEVETASRHKSEFLANMSHELRTPLNAIIGFSQVLKQQMYGELNARQADYVDDVLSSGQHLLNLINDILDLAKVEAGRMELQRAPFELPAVLQNAMSLVRERATRQGVSLITVIDPSVGLLDADERKVKQILFNLLSNAVKFTPSGGRVTLAANVLEEHVEISVRDTGLGIKVEDQSRIFEEFYQVGPGTAQEGTGLGLALTRRLVELHHGRLSVESEPGVGSTFTVTLPLQPALAAPGIVPATAVEAVSP